MPEPEKNCTYRGGKKIFLEKPPDEFVVRALPEELENVGISDAEQVSSASSRVTVRATELEALMSRARYIAPTHYAYYVSDTGKEFLITDRVFVRFRDPSTTDQ